MSHLVSEYPLVTTNNYLEEGVLNLMGMMGGGGGGGGGGKVKLWFRVGATCQFFEHRGGYKLY